MWYLCKIMHKNVCLDTAANNITSEAFRHYIVVKITLTLQIIWNIKFLYILYLNNFGRWPCHQYDYVVHY